jgi:glycopeptide antibiotics resistance protein
VTISSTTTVLPALLVVLALIATPAVRRRVDVARRRPVTLTTLIVYAAAVVALTIFPIDVHPPDFWGHEPWWADIHWIPFYVDAPSMILNVIMFVPFGVLVPSLWPATCTVRRMALLAVSASAAIEVIQFVLGVTLHSRRTADVNDLIANASGALLGLLLWRLAAPGPFFPRDAGFSRDTGFPRDTGFSRAPVVEVASWSPVAVQIIRRDELREPVRTQPDLPFGQVNGPVVVSAEQDQVVQAGRAAVCPGPDVVGVGPSGWAVAAGKRAAAVAQDQGPAQHTGPEAPGAADVEDLTVATQNGGQDLGITGQASGLSR